MSLKHYQCNVHEKKVQVFELIPMDLLDKAKEITMMNLSILYNTNPVPLTICVAPLLGKPEQQGFNPKEEL
jgi:hypothetical protein